MLFYKNNLESNKLYFNTFEIYIIYTMSNSQTFYYFENWLQKQKQKQK